MSERTKDVERARAAERARILGELSAAKGVARKYRNKPKIYNGRRYQSTAEAAYAAQLDMRLLIGDVLDWIPQPAVSLGPARISYHPDFLVVEHGEAYYVDVKGMETPRFEVIKDLWRVHGRLPLLIVYKDRTERIPPCPKA